MGSPLDVLGSNGQYSRCPLGVFTDQMQTLGISRLDFVPQTPHFFLSHTGYEFPERLKAALNGAGLQVGVLTPPPYRYSITAPPGDQRNATLAYYRNAIVLAGALGADRLVLGAAGACWDMSAQQLWCNAAELLFQLCPPAETAGVRLLLAPVMGGDTPLIAESPVLGTAESIAAMLEQVGHPSLGACLDTNVMSACGDTVYHWFEALGQRIGLVRLCDGNYHGWRAWGEGCLPMGRYRQQLAACGYRGEVSLLLPGERYIDCPDHPDRLTLAALREKGVAV